VSINEKVTTTNISASITAEPSFNDVRAGGMCRSQAVVPVIFTIPPKQNNSIFNRFVLDKSPSKYHNVRYHKAPAKASAAYNRGRSDHVIGHFKNAWKEAQRDLNPKAKGADDDDD